MFKVPEFLISVEVWVGLILSLMVLSLIARENILSRLAQYILVGASAGYLAVIALQDILRPQLFAPIMGNALADPTLLIPLILGLLLLSIGTIRIFQPDDSDASRSPTRPSRFGPIQFRRILYSIGTIPVALLLGIALATAVIGAIQGTLLPQFLRAAQMGLTWNGSGADLVSGIITLLVTIGVFLHLYAVPAQRITNKSRPLPDMPLHEKGTLPEQARLTQLQALQSLESPPIHQRLISLWAGLGKRMLWLAAGVIFARLIASRLSLLIAQFEYISNTLKTTQLWQTLMNIIQ